MALEVTHIRFALDLKDDFEVKELNKYLSGAIYPDSRYITKIDRSLTHNYDLYTKKEFFKDDDFKKGWATHMLCDKIQRDVMEELFPDLLGNVEKKTLHGNENWVIRTSIKILHDVLDAKTIDIKRYANYIEYATNPNGEDIDAIKKYNQLLASTYNTNTLSVEDEFAIWLGFGLDKNLLEKIKGKVSELSQDQLVTERIQKMYGEMTKLYKDLYSNNGKRL